MAGDPFAFTIVSRDKFGNDRGDLGVSDGFRAVAVLIDGTSPTYMGVSGAIGYTEVAGTITFNPQTYYHEVVWNPTV